MYRKKLLYVENISPSSSEEHLISYLEKWAPVEQVYFLREKQCTKRSIAGLVRVPNESDLDMLLLRNQQNYRGKRLFMLRCDQTQMFQADHTVIVRNITAKISEENLYDHFEECGKIAFLQIRTDDFAYIAFEDKASVRNAMNKNNKPLKGSNLKIQLLSRNIEMMIINFDTHTLSSKMPDLYRKLTHPAEPRQPAVAQQQQQQQGPPEQQQSQPQQQQQQQQPQQTGNQQQHSQPAKQQQQSRNQQQQQSGNQQQQNQRQQQQNQRQQQQNQRQQPQNQRQQQQQQPQQQRQPQQQPQPQRQQQQPQPQRQQQQQPQPQRQQQQPQPQRQQQQPQPQRQQQQAQPQQQQQQMSTIQMLKEKANAFAEKQQQAQPAPAVQVEQEQKLQETVTPAAPVEVSEDTDDVQIIEPMETEEVADESDSEVQIVDTVGIPPIPSAYKPQPNDLMRPIKASEISMSAAQVKNDRDNRSVWINHIPPETTRLDLVLYLEQFGDVEACKIGSSNNCYFTRWAKVCFVSVDAAQRASEYFLHPFRGHYLFVLSCNRAIDEVPGKVFVLDYLSKFLIYEDVVKSFKHIGNVYYLVRLLDNSYKVRIFFLETVDPAAVLAVKSIDGKPINVEPYTEGMEMKIPKDQQPTFHLERDIMDPKKEARMMKILEIFKEESLNRCDPVVNPDGKTERNVALITNVHCSATDQQIRDYLQPVGNPTFIRRERELYDANCQRVYVGFRTLSMVLKAADLPADRILNNRKPFVFPAWTKPHMDEKNTLKLTFSSRDISVQDIYNGLIHFGPIRFVEKHHAKSAMVVFDSHYDGRANCKLPNSYQFGSVHVVRKEKFKPVLHPYEKIRGYFNSDCWRIGKARKSGFLTKHEKARMRGEMRVNEKALKQDRSMRNSLTTLLNKARTERGEPLLPEEPARPVKKKKAAKAASKEPYTETTKSDQLEPEESIVIDDDDDVVDVSTDTPNKNGPPSQNKNQQNQRNPQNKQQQQRREPPQQRQQQQNQQRQQQQNQQRQQQNQQQQRFGRDRNRNPFAGDGPQQRHPSFNPQQQHQGQHRSMSPWRNNRGPIWNDQQQQFRQQHDQFMPDDRFNRNNDGPFDMFGQQNRNMNLFDQMNQFEQMMAQDFGNFPGNQRNDNGFHDGPMDSDDPPLDRGWGGNQQQDFNRFSPPRQRSPFGRGFRDDDDLNFGRDSPGIPSNIPEDEIDEYIMRKQEAIKRRLEQLDKQLITSVESSRHRDYQQGQRRRQGTVFSDNGDVHYVPNPAAMARNRNRRGADFGRGGGRGGPRGRGPRQNQESRRERETRKRDPFADVDIVPIIRLSEERSPSPKRNRDDAFDPAQFDAAWS